MSEISIKLAAGTNVGLVRKTTKTILLSIVIYANQSGLSPNR